MVSSLLCKVHSQSYSVLYMLLFAVLLAQDCQCMFMQASRYKIIVVAFGARLKILMGFIKLGQVGMST